MAIDRPDPAMNEAEADRLLATNQRNISATLAKADNRMLAGDHRAANIWYGQVGKLAGSGNPIDRAELLRARDATVWLAERFRQAIIEGLATAGHPSTDWHPRFAKSLSIMFGERQRDPVYEQFPQLPQTYFYPDLPYVEFADRTAFAWAEAVEAETPTIRAEAEKLLASGAGFAPYVKRATDRPQGDVHGLLEDPSWSTLELTEKGVPKNERIALAPASHAAITRHAPLCAIPNRAPSIMFSLLRAGARIPPHTGMINARFICHLPLMIPGEGALRVGTKQRKWDEGALLIFDDTVEHEAWNDASDDRLVLIFDVWRPELGQTERDEIAALFATVDAY